MDTPKGRAVPVTLLGGFLGAGKTTLLNRVLGAPHGQRIAVLINDFGELAIDAELVLERTVDTISLVNGCVCCSIRDDLIGAVRSLLLADPRPDRLIVELSGVSEPGSVLRTVELMQRQWPLNLDGVVAVVDAEHFALAEQQEPILVREQLALADVIVLNKADLVDAAAVSELDRRIRQWVPTARVLPAAFADVPAEVVLGAFTDRPATPSSAGGSGSGGGHGFRTFSYVTSDALDLSRLREVVTELPASVFRAKGFVRLAQRSDHRSVLQVVGRRARIDLGAPWAGDVPETRLVFLAAGPDVDPAAVRASFDACRARGRVIDRLGLGSFLRKRFGRDR